MRVAVFLMVAVLASLDIIVRADRFPKIGTYHPLDICVLSGGLLIFVNISIVSRLVNVPTKFFKGNEDDSTKSFTHANSGDEGSGMTAVAAVEKSTKPGQYDALLDASSLSNMDTKPVPGSPLNHETPKETVASHNGKGKLSRPSKLFKKFVFKGLALHFAKNPLDLKGCAFGVKIPITQNFPVYDSLIFLPRVNAMVGVNYPLSYRVALSISVPLQVLSMVLFVMARQMYMKPANAAVGTSNAIVWPTLRSSDSVTRVGLTLAYRYTKKAGHHSVFGPNILYMPAIAVVRRLLPLIVIFPALALGLMMWAYQTFQAYVLESFSRNLHKRLKEKEQQQFSSRHRVHETMVDDMLDEDNQYIPNTPATLSSLQHATHPSPMVVDRPRRTNSSKSVLVADMAVSESTKMGSAAYASLLTSPGHYASSSSTSPTTDVERKKTPFGDAYSLIENWLLSKSPSFAAQMGYYDTNRVLAMGYSLYMEMLLK